MQKVNEQHYIYSEGVLHFSYYPETNVVKAANALSFYRCIEFFAARGFEVEWNKSNINILTLFVSLPEYLTTEDSVAILSSTTEALHNKSKADAEVEQAKLILNNIDNNTKLVIEEKKVNKDMENLAANKTKDRQGVVDWFNRYNIEEARPEHPIMRVSTKSKKSLMAEGRYAIRKLFKEGKLRKLTEDQYLDKLSKYETLQKENET